MKSFFLATLLLFSGFCGTALADDTAREEAAALLDSMDMQPLMDQAITTSIDAQIAQNPQLLPFKNAMLAFFSKYTSYSALREDLIDIYAAEFSGSELRQAREFYATPAGRKFLKKMPELFKSGAELGTAKVQQHLPELKKMVEDETKRIQELKAEDTAAKDTPEAD